MDAWGEGQWWPAGLCPAGRLSGDGISRTVSCVRGELAAGPYSHVTPPAYSVQSFPWRKVPLQPSDHCPAPTQAAQLPLCTWLLWLVASGSAGYRSQLVPSPTSFPFREATPGTCCGWVGELSLAQATSSRGASLLGQPLTPPSPGSSLLLCAKGPCQHWRCTSCEGQVEVK